MGALHDWLTAATVTRAGTGIVRTTDTTRNPRSRPGSVDLASNDYLGLSVDPRVRTAAVRAVERYGAGAGASRVTAGTIAVHAELETAAAELTGQPACLTSRAGTPPTSDC